LQYKKVKIDGAMPKGIGRLWLKCLEVMGRISPMLSPHPSNAEASEGGEKERVEETDLGKFLAEI
jgi:hypothetical protein